jgi:TrmH family RNA methyltransferase
MSTNSDWRGILADIERTRTRLGRTGSALFSIEGTRAHERALRARLPVEAALAASTYAEDRSERTERLLSELRVSGCRVHIVPDGTLAELTEGRDIGAIVGLMRTPRAADLGTVLVEASVRPAVILAAVEVEDPGNVGAMIRTALAAGADAFAAVGISDPYHPKAVRTSMGALFKLPIMVFEKLDRLLTELRAHRVQCVGAVSRGGRPLHERGFSDESVAVLLGSEAFGLAKGERSQIDRLVTVPMSSEVDSFSVNAAAAILLYEIRRPH